MFSLEFRSIFCNEFKLLLFAVMFVAVRPSDVHGSSSVCDEGMFRCNNGRCISSSFVCDGEADCGHSDRSDEESCHLLTTPPPKSCQPDEYQCIDRLCVPSLWVCDGEFDCADGSDETHGCEAHVCDGFQCQSRSCIPKEWECDGTRDCPDNSDENHCAKKILSTEECNIHEKNFLCLDQLKCIQLHDVCNNHADCEDGSDEGGACFSASGADLIGRFIGWLLFTMFCINVILVKPNACFYC